MWGYVTNMIVLGLFYHQKVNGLFSNYLIVKHIVSKMDS